MAEDFYTSTEASEITGCTRRQLQYWREQKIVIPTVNSTGKGRNVYYSLEDLITLAAIQHFSLLGLNLNTTIGIIVALKRAKVLPQRSLEINQKGVLIVLVRYKAPEVYPLTSENLFGGTNIHGLGVVPFFVSVLGKELRMSLNRFGR